MTMTTLVRGRPAASRPLPARRAATHRSWLDRLAAWAERQPRHHHLGRWTAV
jgi:hypothetical protein